MRLNKADGADYLFPENTIFSQLVAAKTLENYTHNSFEFVDPYHVGEVIFCQKKKKN